MTYTPSYPTTSPYAKTPIAGRYMSYLEYRRIPPHYLDTTYTLLNPEYVNRPDLLALDIYGNDELEWVIPVRNGLQDLIFDLQLGVTLIIPAPSYVQSLI